MDGAVRPLLEQLESVLADAGESAAHAPLAFLAGAEVALDPAEVHAASRRALLLLAAGGDPHRDLDPDGRAVRAVAADLDAPGRTGELVAALGRLREQAGGLPGVTASLDELLAAPDTAWRWLAAALLAEALTPED